MTEPTKNRPGDQPLPAGGQECVQDALVRLIEDRKQLGIQRYGSPLMTHNGRDASRDMVEEALDLTVYSMQVAMEFRDLRAAIARVTNLANVWMDAPDPLARAGAADLLSTIRGPQQATNPGPTTDQDTCLTHIKDACDGTTRECVRATNDDSLRFLRRESLLVLLTRLQRGRTLTEEEAGTLRHHVETEMREAETARAAARETRKDAQAVLDRFQAGEEDGHVEHAELTPGQWLWKFNRVTAEERLTVISHLLQDAARGRRCFYMAHDPRVEDDRRTVTTLNRVRDELERWMRNTLEPQTMRALTDIQRALRAPASDTAAATPKEQP
ncbi:hypothetical protein [Streptomyces chartreusis]